MLINDRNFLREKETFLHTSKTRHLIKKSGKLSLSNLLKSSNISLYVIVISAFKAMKNIKKILF